MPKQTRNSLEPADKSPKGWARWWFAMGAREQGTVARLVDKFGLAEEEAESLFNVMREELKVEVAELRRNFAAISEALFRTIKSDTSADWAARQRAQIELEYLLDLPGLAQSPEGQQVDDVQEAFVFHRMLIDSPETTATQKLRSQNRLMALLGYTRRRGSIRRPPLAPPAHRAAAPVNHHPQHAPLPASHLGEYSEETQNIAAPIQAHTADGAGSSFDTWPEQSATCPEEHQPGHAPLCPVRPAPANDLLRPFTGDPEIDAATCRQVQRALEEEADSLEAELARLMDEDGVAPADAADRLQPAIHENYLRQQAVQQILASLPAATPSPPLARAQGPPA